MVKKGMKFEFKAKTQHNEDWDISQFKGKKIISIHKDLNTSICNEQTQMMAELSDKYIDINFISISYDTVTDIKTWCDINGTKNSYILSDRVYGDLGNKYKLVGAGIHKRGFIILDEENHVVDQNFSESILTQRCFEFVESYLNGDRAW